VLSPSLAYLFRTSRGSRTDEARLTRQLLWRELLWRVAITGTASATAQAVSARSQLPLGIRLAGRLLAVPVLVALLVDVPLFGPAPSAVAPPSTSRCRVCAELRGTTSSRSAATVLRVAVGGSRDP
jgi:hypothetical protein